MEEKLIKINPEKNVSYEIICHWKVHTWIISSILYEFYE